MASLEIESTLTDRYQTTVPDAMRRTLKLRKRDRIRYVVRPDGAVLLTRAEGTDEIDPIVGKLCWSAPTYRTSAGTICAIRLRAGLCKTACRSNACLNYLATRACR